MNIQPTQFNRAQAQTLHALKNIDNAVFASNKRVEQAREETFNRMNESLHESEMNNRSLAAENAALRREIYALKRNQRELSETHELQVRSLKEQMQAKETEFRDKIAKLKATIAFIQSSCEKILASVNSVSPYLIPTLPMQCEADLIMKKIAESTPQWQLKNGAVQTIIQQINRIKDLIAEIEEQAKDPNVNPNVYMGTLQLSDDLLKELKEKYYYNPYSYFENKNF